MSASGAVCSVFLADDHRIVREGLRVLLERQPGVSVCGEASDGRVLVREALRLNPDVVVTDLAMPELNGLDAIRQLRTQHYRGAIVVLSQRDERRHVADALDAGANAYVLKEHAFEQVRAAIAAAHEGKTWVSPQLRPLLTGAHVARLVDVLTARELEVLQLFAEGHGTKEIAHRLALSPKTIETHRAKLFAKLGAASVADLARIAIREGVIEP